MTDLDTAAIRRRHVKGATWANSLGNSGGEQCNRCGGNVWPCDTLLLVDEIDALRVQLAQATADAAEWKAAYERADTGWTHTLNEFAKKRDALARVSALLDAIELNDLQLHVVATAAVRAAMKEPADG